MLTNCSGNSQSAINPPAVHVGYTSTQSLNTCSLILKNSKIHILYQVSFGKTVCIGTSVKTTSTISTFKVSWSRDCLFVTQEWMESSFSKTYCTTESMLIMKLNAWLQKVSERFWQHTQKEKQIKDSDLPLSLVCEVPLTSQHFLAAQALPASPLAMLCVACSLQSMQIHLLCHSAASTEGKRCVRWISNK